MSSSIDRTNGRSNEPLLPHMGRADSNQHKGPASLSRFASVSLNKLNEGLGEVVEFRASEVREAIVGNFELHEVKGGENSAPSPSSTSLLIQLGILSCVIGAKNLTKDI